MRERIATKFYSVWIEGRMCFPWGLLDSLGHLLCLPKRLQQPLCDRFDVALGGPLEPLPGPLKPRRGYVSVNESTARDALIDIWRTAFFQHSNWMHFHELAMAEPFNAEGEAQAFCQAISARAYVALQAIGVTDEGLRIRVYTAGDVQQDGVA